ncbi:MAG: hypothetical protein U0V72_00740 [Cytophagales bacterium]
MLKDKLIAQNENVRSFVFKNCEHINTISLEKRKKVKATILDQDLLAEYHILHLLAIPYRVFPNRETLAAWLKDLQTDLVKGNISRSNRLYTQVMELQKVAVDLLNSPDNFVFKVSKETFDKYWSVLEAFRRKSIFKAPKPKNKGLNGVEETEDANIKEIAKEVEENEAVADIHLTKNKSKNRFGLVKATSKVEVSEGYVLPGEVGKFLGTINPYKYSVVLTGDPHAGKTEFLMQMLDAFIKNGQKVALFSIEQGGVESAITKAAMNRNMSEEIQDKLLVTGATPSFEDLKELGKEMDVVAIDSWQKIGMPNTRFDELRLECPNTIWITIFQQNGEGGTRGGVSADYDSPVILKVHKVDKTFVNNFVELKKNRGNSLNRHYMVSTKVCNDGFEPEKVEELD